MKPKKKKEKEKKTIYNVGHSVDCFGGVSVQRAFISSYDKTASIFASLKATLSYF